MENKKVIYVEENEDYYPTEENIYFMCYFMEVMYRDLRLCKNDIISKMSRDYIRNMCEFEDIYHCLSREQLVGEQRETLNLLYGRFNPTEWSNYKVPSVFDMADLYTRLIYHFDGHPIDNFIKVMSSPICNYIDDYNSSFYYENELYIRDCIEEGKIIILGPDS